MLKRTHRKGFATIGMFFVMGFGLFTNPYIINNTTNFHLHYSLAELKGSFLNTEHEFLGYTSNGKYALHLLTSRWFGPSIEIQTTTWGSRKPKTVLFHSEESFDAPKGPLGKDFDIICSNDSRYIAMIRNGWFLDCYDFENRKRNSLDVVLHGKVNENDMTKWKAYHNRISNLIKNDYISVLNSESN